MTDQYHPEKQALEQAEATRVAGAQEADARIVQAEPAVQNRAFEQLRPADRVEMKREVANQHYNAAAEANTRISDATPVGDAGGRPSDLVFEDRQGRPIVVRTWESGDHAYIRAYDTGKMKVPEGVDTGQAGYANVTLEHLPDGSTRARLNDIYTSPEYRNSGIAGGMLDRVEAYARKNGDTEIYGSIDSSEAREFWSSQADKGWVIEPGGAYGEAHYRLSK